MSHNVKVMPCAAASLPQNTVDRLTLKWNFWLKCRFRNTNWIALDRKLLYGHDTNQCAKALSLGSTNWKSMKRQKNIKINFYL